MIRVVSVLAVFACGVTACGDDGEGPDSIACTDNTGFVGVTVTTGLSVGFDWEPPCAVAFLIVQGEAGDQWIISTDNQQWDDPAYQSNRFAPPVTYGTNPQGVDDTFGPEDLFSGLIYELYLYRVLPENSSAVCQVQFGQVCLLALVEFVR